MNIQCMAESKTIDGLSNREKSKFSVARLISNAADHQLRSMAAFDSARYEASRRLSAAQNGFALTDDDRSGTTPVRENKSLEDEVHNALVAELGPTRFGGVWCPLKVRMSLDTKTNAAGGFLVGSDVAPDIVDLMSVSSTLIQMGSQYVYGLRGDVSFNRELSSTGGSWVAENPGVDVPAVDPTLGNVLLTPKTYQATTSYSRQLLNEGRSFNENWVRARLANSHAMAIDAAGINGPGTENQPLGLLKTNGIGDVAIGAAGGAPLASHLIELERLVSVSNAPGGNSCGFLSTGTMRAKLRQTPSFTNASVPVWVGDQCLGSRGAVSNNVPSTLTKGANNDCHAIVFGFWPGLMIGQWNTAVELVVDGYTAKKKGMVEVTSYGLYDIGVLYPNGFAAALDARNV